MEFELELFELDEDELESLLELFELDEDELETLLELLEVESLEVFNVSDETLLSFIFFTLILLFPS